jgi:hypothetical protein
MSAWRRTALTALSACALLTGVAFMAPRAAAAVGPTIPRFGAADFVPTPETPIGFQADGNGWYPGATPAVVEWWDGTPGWGKVAFRGGTGNCQPPLDGRTTDEDLRVLLDRVPKNIIWKIPTPGHTDSQPLVIGDRIVNAYFPHFVVCYDRHTGKELWRDQLEMAFLPELQPDRKTIGPTPDPKEARKRQTLFEIAWAMRYLSLCLRDYDGEEPGPAEYPRVRKAIEHMGQWRNLLEEADPEAVPLLDEEIALAKRFLAGEHAILGVGPRKIAEDRSIYKKVPQFGDFDGGSGAGSRRKSLWSYAEKKLRASLRNNWPGWMPFQCTTSCSDGEVVIVRFYHGQVGAYEVATGKRRWAWRDPEAGMTDGASHMLSPRMKEDLIFLDLLVEDKRKAPNGMLGIDKHNGSVRWFTPHSRGGNAFAGPVLVEVPLEAPAAAGTKRVWPVVVSECADILDQATGRRLGGFPKTTHCSYPLVQGNRVVFGVCHQPRWTGIYRLDADGKGGIAVVEDGGFPLHCGRLPWARNDQFVFHPEGSYDLRTRGLVANDGVVCQGEHHGPSVIGDLFVIISNRDKGNGGDYKYRPRRDGMYLDSCYVSQATARPYDGPKLISNRGLLGGAEAPADIFFDKHLAGFDKLRMIAPRVFCGRYGNFITAYFGHAMNGPVAAGDRIYIQGQCFLYCIGPAVKGTPQDDPKIVAAIWAENDAAKLSARLGEASAQYRYEAVKRLGALKKPLPTEGAGRLAKVLVEDPYEEIRAAAMLALDACDPNGDAGWKALVAGEFQPCYGAEIGYGKPGQREQQERRARLPLLFRALGETEGVALLSRRWPKAAADPVQRRALIDVVIAMRWRVEPMLATALSILSNPKPWGNDPSLRLLPVCFAAMDAASDPAAAEALLKAYPKDWTLYPTFARNLKSERLLAWIEPIALESSHPGSRERIFRAWRAIGKDALPSMERVRAAVAGRDPARDKLAADYAQAIAEQIAVLKGEKKRFVTGPEQAEEKVEP